MKRFFTSSEQLSVTPCDAVLSGMVHRKGYIRRKRLLTDNLRASLKLIII